jgi:hypothetical protein
MLSKREGSKAEQETRDRVALGRPGDLTNKHGTMMLLDESARIPIGNQQEAAVKSQGTTMYPHLSLAPGQRFASKGAYIVRFTDEQGERLVPETAFIVP